MKFPLKDDKFNRWSLRIINFYVWLILGIGVIWSLAYYSDFKQLMGSVILLVGICALIIPKKLISIEYSVYLSLVFYLGIYYLLST